jgi:hypothetical protein
LAVSFKDCPFGTVTGAVGVVWGIVGLLELSSVVVVLFGVSARCGWDATAMAIPVTTMAKIKATRKVDPIPGAGESLLVLCDCFGFISSGIPYPFFL